MRIVFFSKSSINVILSGINAILTYYGLMLMLRIYGPSQTSDAFLYLSSLTLFFASFFAAIYSVCLIPAYITIASRNDHAATSRLLGFVFSLSMIFVLAISFAFNSNYFELMGAFSRFSYHYIATLRPIFVYFGPILVFSVIVEFYRSIVLANSRFILSAFVLILQPLFLVLSLLIFTHTSHGVNLAISLLAAKSVSIIFLVFFVHKSLAVPISLNLKFDNNSSFFISASFPYLIAAVITSATSFAFDYSASGLQTGILTAVLTAQKISLVPLSVLVNPLMEIARVKFSKLQAEKRSYDLHNDYYNPLIIIILIITLPLSLCLFYFSPLISTLLLRDPGALSASTEVASQSLRIFAVGIPIASIFYLNGRVVESYQKLLIPCIFGSLGNLLLCFLTIKSVSIYGFLGIPATKVFMDLVYFLPFGFVMYYCISGFNSFRRFFFSFCIILSLSFICLGVSLLVSTLYTLLFSSYNLIPREYLSLCLYLLLAFAMIFFLSAPMMRRNFNVYQ